MTAPLRFGRAQVRPAERQLLVDGQPVAIGARAFDVLHVLLTHRERVVGKDELLKAVWPGVVVEENNLQVQISTLRKFLGAGAITTVPGQGYQFTAALSGEAGAARSDAAAIPRAGADAPGESSIAVLPFVDMSEKKDQEYFADGMAEEILNLLSRIPGLHVAARTSAFSFKGKSDDITAIAGKLRVANVLEGSVRKWGDQLRITAQLVRADSGFHLWSQTYDRHFDDIFRIQDEIAHAVVDALKIALVARRPSLQTRPANTEAYNLLLQANYFCERNTKADFERAIDFYRRAIDLEPGFALAWARLANVYRFQALNAWVPAADGVARSREAVARSLAIDPDLPHAHRALAKIFANYDWDWAAARRELERAYELDPGDLELAADLAWVGECIFGRFDHFIAAVTVILAHNPIETHALRLLGNAAMLAGRLDESAAAWRRLLLLNPDYACASAQLAIALLLAGRHAEALAAAEGEPDEAWRLSVLPAVLWALGRKAESDAALLELERKFGAGSPYGVAQMHAWRGEADPCFRWLQRAFELRDSGMQWLGIDPMLRGLHADPRYRALLVRMKLDPSGA